VAENPGGPMSDTGLNSFTISDHGCNNQVDIAASARLADGVRIDLFGNHNHLCIGENTIVQGGLLEMRNHDSSIKIGGNCALIGMFRCRASNTHISIGDQTTSMMAHITLHERGSIIIGRDCMLSGDIAMDVSDMHSILDNDSGKRLNPPQDIKIGDHVWLAQGVRVMKGASIGHDTVIGTRALVLGEIPPHSLAVGTPARVINNNISWDRKRLPIAARKEDEAEQKDSFSAG
tara:strand:- start:223 stop:921 length:699 start_codon:yes stop_codon:yes gene_type:complete